MLTAATRDRAPLFDTAPKLDLFQDTLLTLAHDYRIAVQAWAFLPNHYHAILGFADVAPAITVGKWVRHAHRAIGVALNAMDHTPGRRVMYQYWDTCLTHSRAWLARLHYVNQNPVKHALVRNSREYRWCSAAWFETNARPAFVKTVASFKIDRVHVTDDF